MKPCFTPKNSTSETYEFKVGTFESGSLEEILQLINKFDKAVIGTGTTSPVRKISFLRTLLQGEALRKY